MSFSDLKNFKPTEKWSGHGLTSRCGSYAYAEWDSSSNNYYLCVCVRVCVCVCSCFIYAGKFGVVYKGCYTNNEQTVEVAIKTMKGCVKLNLFINRVINLYIDITSYTAEEFVAECNIANKFDHPNVLSLIGVSIVPKDDIPLMIMPYMHHGDVKSYLKSQRGDSVDADELPKVRAILIAS